MAGPLAGGGAPPPREELWPLACQGYGCHTAHTHGQLMGPRGLGNPGPRAGTCLLFLCGQREGASGLREPSCSELKYTPIKMGSWHRLRPGAGLFLAIQSPVSSLALTTAFCASHSDSDLQPLRILVITRPHPHLFIRKISLSRDV